jgi:hypothetical protein
MLGHGLGSVASFVCALWHLSQLTAVHHPRTGDAISRIPPYKHLGFYLNFRYGTKTAQRLATDCISRPAPHRAACLDLLFPIEERLGGAPFLCGPAMSLADAAILPFVRQFAAIDRGWFDSQPLPHTRRWLDDLVASPRFEGAMIRLAPWQSGDPDTRFPADDPTRETR